MTLQVTTQAVSECLHSLHSGVWQVPNFQREFVWRSSQVKELIQSILKGYPLGLVTVWDQPQNAPHTGSEPITLKDGKSKVEYRGYKESPAVIKMILDGKQRLTTLAMVFGGLRPTDGRAQFAGGWYIDLDKYMNRDNGIDFCVTYYRNSEIERKKLKSIASNIEAKKLPLKDFNEYNRYIAAVHNPQTYPSESYPSNDDRDKIEEAITEIQNSINGMKVAIAEIPSKITLGEVCEIFDVLNTTGTKVSTFDLLHNNLYSESNGNFDLRDVFQEASDLGSFGLFCDDNRQEFFCQLVTGAFCLAKDGYGPEYKSISTIKGKDLLSTPLDYYLVIKNDLNKLDVYATDFFSDVIGFQASLKELPYPASSIIYMAIRFTNTEISSSNLTRLYKAFFWRNVLLTRYDQGFLTQFGKDLVDLKSILESQDLENYRSHLDDIFSNTGMKADKEQIRLMLLDGGLNGALRQALYLVLKAKVRKDFVSAGSLDWSSKQASKRVQMHHIFPKAWCKNNYNASDDVRYAIDNYGVNCVSNIVPLGAGVNNRWSQQSPSAALETLLVSFEKNEAVLKSAFVNQEAFNALSKNDIKSFMEERAKLMAEYIFELQDV